MGPPVRDLKARENHEARVVDHIAEPVGALLRGPAHRGVPDPALQRRTGKPQEGHRLAIHDRDVAERCADQPGPA